MKFQSILTVGALSLMGCGHDHGDHDHGGDGNIETQSVGAWTSACESERVHDFELSEVDDESHLHGHITLTYHAAGSDCGTPLYSVIRHMDIEFGELQGDYYAIDADFLISAATPLSPEGVTAMNNASFAGHTDWEGNTQKVISGQTVTVEGGATLELPAANTVGLGIIAVEDSEMNVSIALPGAPRPVDTQDGFTFTKNGDGHGHEH